MNSMFIIFVKDQERSAILYKKILAKTPILDVPGMTEFALSAASSLGIMPLSGIQKLLNKKPELRNPGSQVYNAELYLILPNPQEVVSRSLSAGAVLQSPYEKRSWGNKVAYLLDFDNNLIAVSDSVTASLSD
jgi:uncharacterized protein